MTSHDQIAETRVSLSQRIQGGPASRNPDPVDSGSSESVRAGDDLADTLVAPTDGQADTGGGDHPSRIGRFVFMERIGAGNMGEVYAAYDGQLDRKIALKLVRPWPGDGQGDDDGDSLADQRRHRLLREAQTLARVSHPNVVQVFDAGTYQGWVFVAMELVRGVTLGEWIAGQQERPELSDEARWRAVLGKMIEAGRGLQAAHEAGLVHRDFKPDNALVAEDGRVCVVDFGLACAETRAEAPVSVSWLEPVDSTRVTPDSGDRATLDFPAGASSRSTHGLVGTPAYMSPEQMQGIAADHRSDQYSFCVAVYEALYGRRPVVASDLDSMRQLVTSGEQAELPRGPGIPLGLRKVIKRGLAVDPDERHPDMETLLDALESFSHARSRRGLMALAAGVAAVLVLGVVSFTMWSGVAEPAKRRDPCAAAGSSIAEIWHSAAASRARAAFLATDAPYAAGTWSRLEARLDRHAVAIAEERRYACEAVEGIGLDSDAGSGALSAVFSVHPTQILFERRTFCLDRRQRELEMFVAELSAADARMVENSLHVADRLPLARQCRDAWQVRPAPIPADPALAAQVATLRDHLAEIRFRAQAGKLSEAMEMAVTQKQIADGLGHGPARAEAMFELARIRGESGNESEIVAAERAMLDAVDLAESHRHDELAADIWLELLFLSRRGGNDTTAGHRWARRALAACERIDDPGERTARALSLHGALYHRDGDHATAEQRQRRALALAGDGEQAQTAGHASLATAALWQELAITLYAMGRSRMEEARHAYDHAYTIYTAELDSLHPEVARINFNYALFLKYWPDELERARTMFERARAAWLAIHGPRHARTGKATLELGILEMRRGNLSLAERHARQAHAIYLESFAADHAYQSLPLVLLGNIASRRRDHRQALEAFQRALAIQVQAYGEDHTRVAVTRNNVAIALLRLGDHESAEAMFREVDVQLARLAPEDERLRVLPRLGLAKSLLGQGNAGAAVEILEPALASLQDTPGVEQYRAEIQWALARALLVVDREHARRARELAQRARDTLAERGASWTYDYQEIVEWLREFESGTEAPDRRESPGSGGPG